MSQRRRRTAPLVAVAMMIICACGEPPAAPAPPRSARVDRICAASCGRRKACDASFDEAGCAARCSEKGSVWRGHWRADYVDAAVSCLQTLSCDAVKDARLRDRACFVATRPRPSAAAEHLCEQMAIKDEICRGNDARPRPWDKVRCLASYGMNDDATLEQLIDCESYRCGPNEPGANPHTRTTCRESLATAGSQND